MAPMNAQLSVPIDVSPVVSNGIPVDVTIDALLDTSLDVLINAPPDVLTYTPIDVPTTAFSGTPHYAPLNPTPDGMLGTPLHFPHGTSSHAQTASSSEIPVEVSACWCETRSGGSRACDGGCTQVSGA